MDQADDEEDRSDSGQNDENGDKDSYEEVLDLPLVTGSNPTASDPSMLPATPLDRIDIFNQSGDLPSAPLTNTAMPWAELGTDFGPGAISREMGNNPLLRSCESGIHIETTELTVADGDSVDHTAGISMDKSVMGTGTSFSKSTAYDLTVMVMVADGAD
jgi:hypothetical protein